MRVVVTGSNGFVGMHVVQELVRRGVEVLGVARQPPDAWVQSIHGAGATVPTRIVDLRQRGQLQASLAGESFDALIHAAVITATLPQVERDDALEIVDVNTNGLMDALDAARRAGVQRFVNISSPAALGNVAEDPLTEEARPFPISLYGITKHSGELLTARYAAIHGLSATSVRIAQPYGPGERATASRARTSPLRDWLEAAVQGQPLVAGDLTRERDWTWVGDTARGLVDLTLAAQVAQSLYHLSVGRTWPVSAAMDLIRSAFPHLQVDATPDAPTLNPNLVAPTRPPLDATRLHTDTGWVPQVMLEEGLPRYIEWWRTAGAPPTS